VKKNLFVLAFCAVLAGAMAQTMSGFGLTYNVRIIDSGSTTFNCLGLSSDTYKGDNFGIYTGGDFSLILGGSSDAISLDSYGIKLVGNDMVALAARFNVGRELGFVAGAGLGIDMVLLFPSDTESYDSYPFGGIYAGPGAVVMGKYRFNSGISAYASLRAQFNLFRIIDLQSFIGGSESSFDNSITIVPTVGIMFGN
jgi:hypothetical protein